MATKDFQELIKAQQETTKALMSAEEAARYDAILTERKMAFDKKSEAVKAGLEAKRARQTESDRQQAATEVAKTLTEKTKTDKKLITQSGDAVVVELEKARAEQKEAKKLAGGAFKSDKKYQVATQKVNDLEMTRATEGKEGASLLQAQVEIMANQLGEFAEDNKEYNDRKFEADMATNRERRAAATNPAKQKELDDDRLAMQEKQGGQAPVLIRIETDAGHGAGTPVSKTIAQYADIYGFTLYNMGYKVLPNQINDGVKQ